MPTRILIVCLGNICRSPAAESILRHMATERGIAITVDSCAIGDWHTGSSPDQRMVAAGKQRGWEITGAARPLQTNDFEQFDLVLAADQAIRKHLESVAQNPTQQGKIYLMTDFAPGYHGRDVPDPYHGGPSDFVHALHIIEQACSGLLDHVVSI